MKQTKILLSGCGGRLGRAITARIADRDDCVITAGIDVNDVQAAYPVFASPEAVTESADVIIDCSHHTAVLPLLEYAKAKHSAWSWPETVRFAGLQKKSLEKSTSPSLVMGGLAGSNVVTRNISPAPSQSLVVIRGVLT